MESNAARWHIAARFCSIDDFFAKCPLSKQISATGARACRKGRPQCRSPEGSQRPVLRAGKAPSNRLDANAGDAGWSRCTDI